MSRSFRHTPIRRRRSASAYRHGKRWAARRVRYHRGDLPNGAYFSRLHPHDDRRGTRFYCTWRDWAQTCGQSNRNRNHTRRRTWLRLYRNK